MGKDRDKIRLPKLTLNKNDALRVETRRHETKDGSLGAKYKIWVFKCGNCDNEINVQSGSMKTHSGHCRRCSQLGRPYEFILRELQNHNRGDIPVELTYGQLVNIIETQSGCHYCGTELIYHKHSKVYGVNKSRAHQLDRKDNDLGYLVDNLVPCCWDCNRLKSNRFTYEEFLLLSPALRIIMSARTEDNVELLEDGQKIEREEEC